MNIYAVSGKDSEVLALIKRSELPIEDINGKVELFALKVNDDILGTIGIEHDNNSALLRSLSIEEKQRGKGYGEKLVNFLEQTAEEKGIQVIYLLTTTAESFFAKRGYSVIGRNEVPPFIKQTTEFSSICPSSAIVMKKQLS